MKPIEIFESEEQLNESLKEWQKRLFLEDWVIKAKFVNEMEEGNSGLNVRLPVQKYALIQILKNNDKMTLDDEIVGKQPQELVLVHELLHCKISILNNDNGTYEVEMAEYFYHSLLEQLAKSLIMAKYDLTFDYFKG